MAHLEDAVVVGTAAGLVSQLVREKKDSELAEEMNKSMQKRAKAGIARQQQAPVVKRLPLGAGSQRNQNTPLNDRKPIRIPQSGLINPSISLEIRKTLAVAQLFASSSSGDGQMITSPIRSDGMQKDYTFLRFARAGLESAVQLLTYEAARRYVMEVGPYFQGTLLSLQ